MIDRNKIVELIGSRYEDNQFKIKNGHVDGAELDNYFQRTMRNAFGRTGLSMSAIDFDLQRRKLDIQQKRSGKVVIAGVSSSLSIGVTDEDLVLSDFEDTRKILVPNVGKFDRDRWCDDRISELSLALEHKPDVVCFPEFSYPPPIEGRTYKSTRRATSISSNIEVDNEYIDRSSYGRNRQDFENRVIDKLNGAGEPFVFLGSFHCPFDFYNIGVIFPLGGHTAEFDVKKQTKSFDGEQESTSYKLIPPVLYRKRFPSRRVLEYARVPSNLEYHSYHIDGLHIVSIICSDTLDLNQVYNFARINAGDGGRDIIDVILVPSFNLSSKHVSMCRELSFLTGAFVVMVNANDKKSKINTTAHKENAITSKIFFAGFSNEDLSRLTGLSAEIIKVVDEKETNNGAVVYTYQLDLDLRSKFYDRVNKVRSDNLVRGSGRTGVIF